MNKVKIQTDDHGTIDSVSVNGIYLNGVQSVSYRHDLGKLPVVVIELIAELYHTDPEDEYRAVSNHVRRTGKAQ